MNATKQSNKGNQNNAANKKGNVSSQVQSATQIQANVQSNYLQNKQNQAASAIQGENEARTDPVNNPEQKNSNDTQVKKSQSKGAWASGQPQALNSKNTPQYQKSLRSHAQQGVSNSGKSSIQKTPKEKIGQSDKTFKNYESNMTSTSPDRFEDVKQKSSPNIKIVEEFDKDKQKQLQKKCDKSQAQLLKSVEFDDSNILKSKDSLVIDTSGKDILDVQQSAALAQKKLTMVLRDPSKRKSTKKWDSQESEDIAVKPQKEVQQKSGNQKDKSQKSSVQKSQISEYPLQKSSSLKKSSYVNQKQQEHFLNPEKVSLNQIQKLEKSKSVLNQVIKEQKEESDKNLQDQEMIQESEDEDEEDEIDEEEEEDLSDIDKSQSDQQDEEDDLDSSDKDDSQTSQSKPDIDQDLKKRRKLAFMKEQQIANRALRIKMGKSGAQAATRKNIKKGKDACQRKLWDQPEDDAIVQLVAEHGTKRWTYIAQQLTEEFKIGGRTGKQCRERWHNHLDPSIKKSPINSIEEKIIFDAHKVYGNKWADIAKLLDGRSDNCIKNYYYSTLRKHIRRINKSLKQCQVAKRLNLKVKTLSADILFPLVKDGKISYSQVKSIDPKKFEDLEHTMRMIFNHEDGQQVTQRGIIAANQNRLKVEMKLEEMRMNELKEQQDITDKKRNKKAKNSDEKEKRKNAKQQSETESFNEDQSIQNEQNNLIQNEIDEKKTKSKQSFLGKRKIQKNQQSSSQLQKQKRQKINEQTKKDNDKQSKSSSDSDSDMKDQEMTQTEDDQILTSNHQEAKKKKSDNFQNNKQEQKFEEKVGEFNINTQLKISSGHKNEHKQNQRLEQNEQDSQKSQSIDNIQIQKIVDDSAKSRQKQINDKKATQKNILQTANDSKPNFQNTTEQSLSTLLQKNFNSQILPSNQIAPSTKQNNLEVNQMKSLILKPNFKNDLYQINNDSLKVHSQQQHSQNESAVNLPAKPGPGIGSQYGMLLNGQPSLMSMINHGYKGYGSGLPFHPFSLANPSYYKNSLSEQANFDLQMQLAQRQHKSKKIKESSAIAEKDNGDVSKQKSSSHQHHSSHRSNKKKKKSKKEKKKSHRDRGEKGIFGLDSGLNGHFYDYSKQRSSSRYPGSFLNPGPVFPSYMNDYAAYNNFIESNYGSSIYPIAPPGNHGMIGPGMTDMIHMNKNLSSQSKLFHPMPHMFDPNFHKSKNMGQQNIQSSQAGFHPSIIPQAAPANSSSGLHPHLQQFFMQGSQLGATSGGNTQEQPSSFNHFAHGASGPMHQQYMYSNPYYPGAYYPFDPHHHPSSFGAAGQSQSAHSGLTNPLFIPSYNQGANNQESLSKLAKNNSTQNVNEQNGQKQNNSIQKNFKNQIFMDNQKEKATGYFLNMNSNLKKSDQKSDLNIQKNNGSLNEKENSEIKLDMKKSVKSAKSSPTRQKSIEDETKISKSQQQVKDQSKIDKSKTLSDMKNKRLSENIGDGMADYHYYGPQSYNHQMQQMHAFFQKNGHYPTGMGMPHPYMMGMPPYYHMMMHPGMPMMPHLHPFLGSHIPHKQDLDDQAIHSRSNQQNNQSKAAKKDQNYQQKTHGYYHHHSQFEMPATPVNVKQQTFTIKDLFFGNGDGQTSQGQGSHTPKQGLLAKCIRQHSNISQSLINKTSGTKDPSADGQQQKGLRNDQQALEQNQKRSLNDQQQKGGQQLQNQLNNSLPAQYNNTITFMINNFASGPIGASQSSVGGKQNENNAHESLTNIPKTNSDNQLMLPKQQKSSSNTALKFHKIQTGDQSSQKDKHLMNDHQECQQKNDKSPQSLSPKKQISQRIADGIKAFQQINIANQQNQSSISQTFKQKISIGQLKDFQRKQADFFNSRGVTPSGHNGAIPLISTSNFLIGGGVGSQNIHHIFGLNAGQMIQSTSQFNMNPERQIMFNDKNQSQGIFVQNGSKFIQSKILAGTPRLLKGQGIGNFILQKGKILHQSVTPKGNGFSKSQLASAALLNETQQEKIALQISVQKQSSQANQQQKQLLQSNRHFNLNSGHTFNGNSGGFGNNSRIGSKLNTKTNAQVQNNNVTASKVHTIITPKVSTIDKDPEMHRKILEKILKSGSNNQFYDYNIGMGARIQAHGGAMTDSKVKHEEEMGGAFTKKININNNQSYGSRENINLKISESAGKDMQQQKQLNDKIMESNAADFGNMKQDLNATGQKSGQLSSNQRDAEIQERDSLGLFHINRQAIINNLALNQEPLSSIYTGAPMNKNISFGIGLFQSNINQQKQQNEGQDNLQGDFSIQNISALQTPLLGQKMHEELDQENGMAQLLISQKNQNNTKAFVIDENDQENQKQKDNQFSVIPVKIIRSGQNGASSTKKKKGDQEIDRDSILDSSDNENNDNQVEKNQIMKTQENLQIILDEQQEVFNKVGNEDQEMQD